MKEVWHRSGFDDASNSKCHFDAICTPRLSQSTNFKVKNAKSEFFNNQ